MSTVGERTDFTDVTDSSAYRAFLSIDDALQVIELVVEQFSSWLREKGWDPQLADSGFHTDGDRDLLVIHHSSSLGVAFRGRLIEKTHQGTWRTQLTAFAPHRGTPWVALEVTNSQGRFVAVPRIATYLLDTLPARDGESSLSSTARLVGPGDDLEGVMESICDPHRQGLYLVAGTGHTDVDLEVFRKRVDLWAKQVRGLAQVVVLTPDATDSLRDVFGPSHCVRPWTLRTFQPDTDPAIEEDGLRHKFLTTQRLANDKPAEITKLLGRVARRHSSRRTPPEGYTRLDRALARVEDILLLDALASPALLIAPKSEVEPTATLMHELAEIDVDTEVVQGPAIAPSDNPLSRTLDLVKILFGIEAVTEERLREIADAAERGRKSSLAIDRVREELEQRQQTIDALQDRLADTNEDYETALLDSAIAESDAAAQADEARWLRGRLAQLADYDSAYAAIPQDSRTIYPNDFDELVSKLDGLEPQGVVFTGDRTHIADLDEFDTLNRAVKLAWDALLTLADYVRARNEGKCEVGLKQYLDKTPQGFRAVGPKKFAEGETAATMSAHGSTRLFPVPRVVNQSGFASMEAHFKLGKLGRISPRLHHVDCWPINRKIYVGYIGPHLPIANDS